MVALERGSAALLERKCPSMFAFRERKWLFRERKNVLFCLLNLGPFVDECHIVQTRMAKIGC